MSDDKLAKRERLKWSGAMDDSPKRWILINTFVTAGPICGIATALTTVLTMRIGLFDSNSLGVILGCVFLAGPVLGYLCSVLTWPTMRYVRDTFRAQEKGRELEQRIVELEEKLTQTRQTE